MSIKDIEDAENNVDDKGNAYIPVAKLLSPHGIKGYITLKSFTSPEANIFSYKKLYDSDSNEIIIHKQGKKNDSFIISVDNIADRNDAENLNGNLLYIEKDDLADIKNDKEFYYINLVGLDVLSKTDNKKVGEITSVENYGAGDLLEIKFLNDKKELYIFSERTFSEVNIEEGYIIADFPEVITVQDNRKKNKKNPKNNTKQE